MDAFVLTVIGRDRTGLVAALSRVVADHGGSWDRGHISELAGWFAGVVVVRLPTSSDAFEAALVGLADQGLEVVLRPALQMTDDVARERVGIEIVGVDRPGIVVEISALLTSMDVGIVDLRTWTEPAAVAGGELFRVVASLTLPHDVDRPTLADALERLADDLMVDLIDQDQTST